MFQTIGRKLFVIGIAILIGATIIAGNAYNVNRLIQETSLRANAKSREMGALHQVFHDQSRLRFAAMHFIADLKTKDVNRETVAEIKRYSAAVSEGVARLSALMPAGERQRIIQDLHSSHRILSGFIGKLTPHSAAATDADQALDLWNERHKAIDEVGKAVEMNLMRLLDIVHKEQKAISQDLSGLIDRTTHHGLLAYALVTGVIMSLFIAMYRSITRPLKAVARRLSLAAEALKTTAFGTAGTGERLSRGVKDHHGSLATMVESLGDMENITEQNAETAARADHAMAEVVAHIEKLQESMHHLTDFMTSASASGESAFDVIKSIDDISFQTNILSLNAAVEAARAGDSGASFSVVAGEVRRLSLRTADAAKNTGEILKSMVERIQEGVSLVSRTEAAFLEATARCRDVAGSLSGIAASADRHSQGVRNITAVAGTQKEVVENNAANAAFVASTAAEMREQSDRLQSDMERLLAMVGSNGRQIKKISELSLLDKKIKPISRQNTVFT